MTQIGIQLHSIRALDEELPAVLRRVNDHGFDAVEFAAGIQAADIDGVRRALDETDLFPIGAHVGLARMESDLDALVQRFESIGCDRFVVPHISADRLLSADRVDGVARRLNDLAERLRARGFELVVHNSREMHLPVLDGYYLDRTVEAGAVPRGVWTHLAWGLDRLSPRGLRPETAFERLVAQTDRDAVGFEVDIGHVASANRDPASVFDVVQDRLVAVHVCDAERSRWLPPAYRSKNLGGGMVRLERAINEAARHDIDWFIVENDYPTDPVEVLDNGIDVVEPLVAGGRATDADAQKGRP